ncbi:MAG: hypothetical protein HZB59_12420 [Ignavibacteriales bacterium]|nr:hypothetical protein [Ignavibacteriales bacterium]
MWETLAIEVGKKAVEKFFEGFKKKDDPNIVSIGLAVGYYYNFLDPISNEIKRDELKIYSSPEEGTFQKFVSEEVRVQIIIPTRLEVEAYQRCEDEFKSAVKGFIYLSENKRYYGINYSIAQLASKKELTIIDLARPIMSSKRYYEDIVKLDTYKKTDEKWLKIQVTEITAFKETLRRLQQRGYGGLVNKLDFRERE